jgi:uncharacterized membrane protein
MTKTRLEAFSDGVLAIIITIMVLELRVPEGDGLAALRPLVPTLLAYVLSFLYIGIYWNNHHHLLHTVTHVNGKVLWANLHLLFWLSLLPFVTGWLDEHHLAAIPSALYGVDLIMAALAYTILQTTLIQADGRDAVLARAVGRDRKGKLSLAIYAAAIALAFVSSVLAQLLYAFVALMWIVPDRRIERVLEPPRR